MPKLTKAQQKILASVDNRENKACISVMTLWEIAILHALGRLQFDFPFREWLRSIYHHEQLEIISLDPDIIYESSLLRESLPGDPVDQIIVASAKLHGITLLTSDKKIRDEAGIPVV